MVQDGSKDADGVALAACGVHHVGHRDRVVLNSWSVLYVIHVHYIRDSPFRIRVVESLVLFAMLVIEGAGDGII